MCLQASETMTWYVSDVLRRGKSTKFKSNPKSSSLFLLPFILTVTSVLHPYHYWPCIWRVLLSKLEPPSNLQLVCPSPDVGASLSGFVVCVIDFGIPAWHCRTMHLIQLCEEIMIIFMIYAFTLRPAPNVLVKVFGYWSIAFISLIVNVSVFFPSFCLVNRDYMTLQYEKNQCILVY